jgi:hypothetical protein
MVLRYHINAMWVLCQSPSRESNISEDNSKSRSYAPHTEPT